MAELLEQIKKMSRAEQLALAQQIWDLEAEKDTVEEDEEFKAELIRRAQHAIGNPQSGIPWEEVKARLLARQREQSG
jgi:putative addiction module component (TIGR02574 family)